VYLAKAQAALYALVVPVAVDQAAAVEVYLIRQVRLVADGDALEAEHQIYAEPLVIKAHPRDMPLAQMQQLAEVAEVAQVFV
jgi:hypothetical protein